MKTRMSWLNSATVQASFIISVRLRWQTRHHLSSFTGYTYSTTSSPRVWASISTTGTKKVTKIWSVPQESQARDLRECPVELFIMIYEGFQLKSAKWNLKMRPVKWKPLSNVFLWYCFLWILFSNFWVYEWNPELWLFKWTEVVRWAVLPSLWTFSIFPKRNLLC